VYEAAGRAAPIYSDPAIVIGHTLTTATHVA
jgi:hypothetical protein